MRPLIVMTGAARYLGGHFLHAQDDAASIIPLVCAEGLEKAGLMIREAIHLARIAHDEKSAVDAGNAYQPLACDFRKPGLGLGDSALARIRDEKTRSGSLEFWHLEEDPDAELTDRLLNLAAELGAARFVCLSSVQVCGTGTGDLPVSEYASSPEFNNGEEESWWRMEGRVSGFCRKQGMDYRILRVPMLVGPSLTKKWEGCGNDLSGLVKAFLDSKPDLLARNKPIALTGDPQAYLHLMPVDHCIRDIGLIRDQGFPGGPIYHLTPNVRVTAGFALDYLNKVLALPGIVLDPEGARQQDPIEANLGKRLESFTRHIRQPKNFVRSLEGRAGVTRFDFFSYIHEAVRRFAGEGNLDLFKSTLMPVNGVLLNVYTSGSAEHPPLILINAVGMPVDLWSKTARYLNNRYRLYTWESRGVPSRFEHEADGPWDIDDHIRDCLAVMERFGLESAHVAGWCSGAQVASKFAATHPRRVRSLILLNGIFSLKDRGCTSEFMGVLAATMTKVARSRKYADMYFRLNYGAKQKDLPDIEPGSLDLEYDPALFHLTSFPFKDPESLFQYANLVKCMVSEHTDDWIERIDCPAMIISGGKDITAGPKSSRKVAQQLAARASFHEIKAGDHYSICYDDRVSVMIDDFIQSCPEGGTP